MAKKKKVGIDIGHGKNTYDTGGGKGVVVAKKVYEEHDFNSAVGVIVNKRLKALGFDVFMAQPANSNDVALSKRTDLYNKEKCDLVVSIHANAGTPKAEGACAFYWHTSASGKKLAQLFMKHFKSTVKGVKQFGTGAIASVPNTWTNFHMVRVTKMDAILVEAGFMTNDNDFDYIFGSKKKAFISQVAEAIVKAVCEHQGVKYKAEAKAPVKAPVSPTGNKHKIVSGDTFYSIATKYKVTVAELQKANPKVKAGALQIGEYLVIPGKAVKTHKVVAGDTFYSLSVKYKTTVSAIQKANPKADPGALSIGQVIMIP